MLNSIIVIFQAKVCRNFPVHFHLVIGGGDLRQSSPLSNSLPVLVLQNAVHG